VPNVVGKSARRWSGKAHETRLTRLLRILRAFSFRTWMIDTSRAVDNAVKWSTCRIADTFDIYTSTSCIPSFNDIHRCPTSVPRERQHKPHSNGERKRERTGGTSGKSARLPPIRHVMKLKRIQPIMRLKWDSLFTVLTSLHSCKEHTP
jgi:hypothetical protein